MFPLPHGCMRFLPCFGAFFCSTAPQAFFRPDRRFRTPACAEAVKVGRRSAIEAHSTFPGRALTASSTAADWMITGRKRARLSSLVPLFFARLYFVSGRSMSPKPDLLPFLGAMPSIDAARCEADRQHSRPDIVLEDVPATDGR